MKDKISILETQIFELVLLRKVKELALFSRNTFDRGLPSDLEQRHDLNGAEGLLDNQNGYSYNPVKRKRLQNGRTTLLSLQMLVRTLSVWMPVQ